MKIKEIRDTIARLNWNRQDATGGTRDENRRTNLPIILASHITAVEALEIPPRFLRDIEDRSHAIQRAKLAIERWHAATLTTPQPTPE